MLLFGDILKIARFMLVPRFPRLSFVICHLHLTPPIFSKFLYELINLRRRFNVLCFSFRLSALRTKFLVLPIKFRMFNQPRNCASWTRMNLTSIIDNLENGNYLRSQDNRLIRQNAVEKIEEFSNWLNGIGRCQLLKSSIKDADVLLYHLCNLKQAVSDACRDISNSVSSRKYRFTCSICGKKIVIHPWQDFWSCLQDHEHIEQKLINVENESEPSTDDEEAASSSGTSSNSIPSSDLADTKKGNDFKFNFDINYDKQITSTIYPDSLVSAAQKCDGLKEYSVQLCGKNRAICLLCPCHIGVKARNGRVSAYLISNHAIGQRHLRCASYPDNLSALQKYHSFWRRQAVGLQAHQVYFMPDIASINSGHCTLCAKIVAYDNLVQHINDKPHRNKVIKLYKSHEGKLKTFYLMDIQAEMYGIQANHDVQQNNNAVQSGPGNIQKKTNENTNSTSSPEKHCVIKKTPSSIDVGNGIKDMLPERFKEHAKILQKKGSVLSCTPCKISLGSDLANIIKHLTDRAHRESANIPLHVYRYYCDVCNFHFTDEYSWEGHFSQGPNRHASAAETRKSKLAEYECVACLLVLYGDDLTLMRHMSAVTPNKTKTHEVKLSFAVKRLFKTKIWLEMEAKRLTFEANEVLTRQDIMWRCCTNLQEAISSSYPKCKAYPFGSRISGLGTIRSDLDIFMDTGDMYTGMKHQDPHNQEQFVIKLSILLKKFKDDFKSVFPIPSARTPIIKLHHVATKMDCDVSFRHGLGVENTRFIKFCIDLQPITQPFIILLKRWSDHCKLNEHITNYGLALMGIFFLQLHGYLLSVKKLRKLCPDKSLVIDGWDTINYTVPVQRLTQFVKLYDNDLATLLKDFFLYFSIFKYANDVVCPLLGYTIPKVLFNGNGENLPFEMRSYVERIKNEDGEIFRALSPFCVQDPFDLSHNLTKACQQGTIMKWKTLCKLTYEFLNTIE